MDIYNKVRDIIIDVVTKRYNQLDIKTLNLITCEQPKNFKFDVMSSSKKNVIRGLHIQTKKPQAKVITVVLGKIMDVAVDLRKNSKTFGKYYSLIISDKSEYSFYIPEGFAHGFLCLSNKCIVHYKCSEYRHKESETTLDWRDQEVKIKWPIKKPIMSKKDKIGKNLEFFR